MWDSRQGGAVPERGPRHVYQIGLVGRRTRFRIGAGGGSVDSLSRA